MSPKGLYTAEKRRRKKPKYACECLKNRFVVRLIFIECGDLSQEKDDPDELYECPGHGRGFKKLADAWAYCFSCKGLIE